jgi:NADH-quinone oxidoreductase subunit H
VYGTLEEAVLDFFPLTLDEELAARRKLEGQRLLQFIGVTLDESTLTVERLEPKGRAARAGLQTGDRLLALASVNLVRLEDLALAGAGATAEVQFRRGRLKEPVTAQLDVAGFKPRAAEELVGAAALVGVAAALLLFFAAPVSRLMSWLERKLLHRLVREGGRRDERRRGWLERMGEVALGNDLLPRGVWGGLLRPAPYVVFLMVSVAVTLVSLGQPLLVAELDLAILFLLSATTCMTTALLLGGWSRLRGRWSLLLGARAATSTLLFQIPALCGLGCVFLRSGSLSPADLVATQGVAPWTWTAFQGPTMLLAFVLLLATALPESSRGGGHLAAQPGAERRRWDHRFSRYLMFVAEWGHLWVVSAILAIVFLGGWNVPGVGAASAAQKLAGAAVLAFKTWALCVLVIGVRWVALRAALADLLGVWFRYLLPLSVVCLGVTLGASRLPLDQALGAQAKGAVGMAVFSVVVSIFGLFLLRVFRGLRGGVAPPSLNPWL